VIFTGTSNTGGSAIEYITSHFSGKVNIRAIVRKPGAGDIFQGLPGVDVVIGDITKTPILGPVFQGANAAFFSTPTTTNRADLGKRFVDACIEHGVQYGVFISVLGASKKQTAYQKQFAEIEAYALSKAGTPVKLAVGDKGKVKFAPVILRCAPFYQNFYGSLVGIQSGVLHFPLGLNKFPHVDFMDVGKCIAHILVNPEPHAGKIYNLIGEFQAGNQLAAAITMKAGVPCTYETVADDIAALAFEQLGLQPWIARGNVEQIKWLREGGADGEPLGDIQAITGAPATRFGDFVRDNLKPMLA